MTEEVRAESGWLIEIPGPLWWAAYDLGCGRRWTADSNEAVRFCRRQDALAVIRGMTPCVKDAIATDHLWIDHVV